jgi:uncharacterized protein
LQEVFGKIAELWRYPVSGFRGERLSSVQTLTTGLSGDHVYALRSKETGKILDPKVFQFSWGETQGAPSMLQLKAELVGDPAGEHSVNITDPDGRVFSIDDPDIDAVLSETLRHQVELVKYPRIVESRAKAGRTVHLLTSASLSYIKSFHPKGDFDVRRFRPNIVVDTPGGVSGFVEETWQGVSVSAGQSVLKIGKGNRRCNVTTMKQGDLGEDPAILQVIEKENERRLGVLCTVLGEGRVSVGDALVPVGQASPE